MMTLIKCAFFLGVGYVLSKLYAHQVLPGWAAILIGLAVLALNAFIEFRQDKSKKEDKSAR